MKEEVRPLHYGGDENPFEPIKIIEHYDLGFNLGNVLKYILRHKKKDGLKDLKKALTYILFEIGKVERMEGKSQSPPSVSHQNKPLSKAEKEAFAEALDYPQLQLRQYPKNWTKCITCEEIHNLVVVNTDFTVVITRAKDCDLLINLLKNKSVKTNIEVSIFKALEDTDRCLDYSTKFIHLSVLKDNNGFSTSALNYSEKTFLATKDAFLLWED